MIGERAGYTTAPGCIGQHDGCRCWRVQRGIDGERAGEIFAAGVIQSGNGFVRCGEVKWTRKGCEPAVEGLGMKSEFFHALPIGVVVEALADALERIDLGRPKIERLGRR